MKKQTQKIVASEISQNFKMLLYGLSLAFIAGMVLFLVFLPPKNGSIPADKVQEYREFKSPPTQYNWDGTIKIQPQRYFSLGSVLKNRSRYDREIPIDDAILNNAVDYYRMKYHWRFVWKYTKLALFILLPVLMLGRYLVLLVKWIQHNPGHE